MPAIYSREFADYSAGAIARSDVAEQLSAVLDPEWLDALKKYIKYTEESGIYMELVDLRIRAAYVIGVKYDRVPRRAAPSTLGNTASDAAEDERMRICVYFETTESLKVKRPGDVEPELATNDKFVVWQFESLVTSLDVIDWRTDPTEMVVGSKRPTSS